MSYRGRDGVHRPDRRRLALAGLAVPGVPTPGVRGSLVARRPSQRRRLKPEQRKLIDGIEKAVRSIRYPVDNAAIFMLQVAWALDRAGYFMAREVPCGAGRRVDLVVVSKGVTVAVECDRFNPRSSSFDKFESLPSDVVRVMLLRRRITPLKLPWADRTICMRATLKMVAWLTDGSITDMAQVNDTHKKRAELVPLLREELLVGRVGTIHSRRR